MGEDRWTVQEILPTIVYTFRDIVEHFEDRFPAEPFFIHMIKMPPENSVKFLAPLISPLHARKERAHSIIKLYQENIVPLGFFAGVLGIRIADVMHASRALADMGPLWVEWSDMEGQAESRDAARVATCVVLTRSAIETLAELEILDRIEDAYEWYAPQSLVDALEKECSDAEERFHEGFQALVADESGFRAEEVLPGDPSLQARMDRARKLSGWVAKRARVEHRPLDTIERPGSPDEEARARIGADSLDAVRVAQHFGITMLSDDLGLRRMLPRDSGARSFSTVWLIPALADAGRLSARDAERLLLELVERNYAPILPTRGLLAAAIKQERGATASLRRAFGLLAGPILDLSSAARLAADALKASLLLPVRVIEVAPLTQIILEALASKWPPVLCANTFRKAASVELALLPIEMRSVRETVTVFVKSLSR
jgi:hypothetical protein